MDAQLFDEMAQVQANHWWFQGRRAVVHQALRRWLPEDPARTVLDVGCGTGSMLPMLQAFGKVEGLEASEHAVAACRRQLGDAVTVHTGMLPDGVPAGRRYDVVSAFDVLEHIPDAALQPALGALRAALRPGGLFVCTVPAFRFLWSEHDTVHQHQRRYTDALLRAQLGEAGFDVQWSSYFNTLLFPPIAAARLLGKLLPARRHGGSDLQASGALANAVLGAVFGAERHLVGRVPLPVGVSLLAVARPRAG